MTFSIVARDPRGGPGTSEWGIAVASKFLAVGAVVGWARAGVGAVATQSFVNVGYGEQALSLMAEGESAAAALRTITSADEMREKRQVGIVDAGGNAATFTGDGCFDWAGGRTGDGYACQGNILTGADVVDAMAETFESTSGDLAERLVAALAAGDARGGDRRGRQSASLLVVRENNDTYGGGTDRAFDLRVDDHPDPVPELARLLDLQRLYLPAKDSLEFVAIDEALAAELRELLASHGFATEGSGYDDDLRDALFAYMGNENLEERWTDDPAVEKKVLEFLRGSARRL